MTIKNLIAQIFTLEDWNEETWKTFLWGGLAALLFLAIPYAIALIGRWGLEHGIFPL